MNNELFLALNPTIFLSVCSGIMMIGTILYLYVFSFTKTQLYLSISMLGLFGALFISFEAMVISAGILGNADTGYLFHRLQALSATFFFPALPYFIYHLVAPGPARKKILKIMGYSGIGICAAFIVLTLLIPEIFLSRAKPEGAIMYLWNLGRGTPGWLYKIRDIMIGVWALICAAIMAADVFLSGRSRHILLAFIGAVVAISSGILDLFLAAKEGATGLFSVRTFSMFSLGMTIFIFLSMVGVMKFFVDQTRGIEKAMKLQSLGTLAGGIAHDFNNTLTSIVGNISIINQDLDPRSEYAQIFRDIETAAFKARRLTEQLLTFSKGGGPIRKLTSTDTLIIETANFMMAGSGIDLEFDLPDDLWNITADAGQISQVIQNIIINAKQALGDSGRIKISGTNLDVYINPEGAKLEYPYVRLEICDNGPGIPQKHQKHIFDPYFTTKEEGSGLGLYICYSIINNHNGHIDVSSVSGQGTCFGIYLPANKEKIREEKKQEIIHTAGKFRALVLEDDRGIQRVLEKMLERVNIKSVLTSAGEDTVKIFREYLDKDKIFDLVILDLTIVGGMGGRDTAEELLKIKPDQKIIVSSGYSNDPVMSGYEKHGFSGIIRKPYRFQEFEQTIMNVLYSGEHEEKV